MWPTLMRQIDRCSTISLMLFTLLFLLLFLQDLNIWLVIPFHHFNIWLHIWIHSEVLRCPGHTVYITQDLNVWFCVKLLWGYRQVLWQVTGCQCILDWLNRGDVALSICVQMQKWKKPKYVIIGKTSTLVIECKRENIWLLLTFAFINWRV